MVRRFFSVIFFVGLSVSINAQKVISLEDCHRMALEKSKTHKIAEEEAKAASYKKKAAFTKYLPDLSLKGAYIRNEKETSLVGQDMYLPIGTVSENGFGFETPTMQADGTLSSRQLNNKWVLLGNGSAAPLDENGAPFDPRKNPEKLQWKEHTIIPKDELTFDTRNMYVVALNLTQPIFMGGKIVAYNKIASINKELAASKLEADRQATLASVDDAYWQIVSLENKKKAVEALISFLDKMLKDVSGLKESGLATKADELSVQVKQNEAQMAMLRIENGISLSKMLLAQICGMDMNEPFELSDTDLDSAQTTQDENYNPNMAFENRSELKSLNYATNIYKQKEKVVRADMLPNVALTANYIGMNPNLQSGFEKKFRFTWNVGVVINVPLLHWGEQIHLLNEAKSETNIAQLKYDDTREKIELQVNQSIFKKNEAEKKLELSKKNLERAEENLKHATLSFNEGMIPSSNLLEAQTAWLSASTDKIDAEIENILSDIHLKKALGILGAETKESK